MKRGISCVTVVVLCLSLVGALGAAQKTTQISPGRGGSPHVHTAWVIRGANISIEYGRPYLKGRPDAQMMPPGVPWRIGADEATIITSDKPLTFGAVKVAAGTYTINAQPGATWQLIIGRLDRPGQWGIPYQPGLEIGRAPMKVARTKAPVEQVTCAIDPTATGATLRIEWGAVSATIPFTIG